MGYNPFFYEKPISCTLSELCHRKFVRTVPLLRRELLLIHTIKQSISLHENTH